MTVRRLFVLFIVVAWLAPSAGAMVLSMHVALHHHHEHGGGHPHDATAADLLAVSHGHRHDEVEPHHDHEAPLAASPSLKAESTLAQTPAVTVTAPARTPGSIASRGAPGSTLPLFYSHCSLRL